MSKKLKVAVGMSGGVDSGVSAKLLVDAGYDVTGVHLHFWAESVEGETRQNKCCSTESLMAARRTCDMLGIPFLTYNFEDVFKETVVEYFLEEYRNLRTPNPCVVCNRKIKTGRLVKYVQALGYDLMATGHYIRLVQRGMDGGEERIQNIQDGKWSTEYGSQKLEVRRQDVRDKSRGDNKDDEDKLKAENGKIINYKEILYTDMEKRRELLENYPDHNPVFLQRGRDLKKDQSYFLYTMKQEDLVRLIFPLAGMIKEETKRLAQQWKLPVASSKESFEICFVPTDDHREFLERHLDKDSYAEGDVVTEAGEVVGKHRGLPFYSEGQRRGFTTFKPLPFYVIGKDKDKNQLVVSDAYRSMRKKFSVERVTWANEDIALPLKCGVRLRNMGSIEDCLIEERDTKQKIEITNHKLQITDKIQNLKFKTQDEQVMKTENEQRTTDNLIVTLEQPQRGITPGQSAVFYDGDVVLGGGVIKSVFVNNL